MNKTDASDYAQSFDPKACESRMVKRAQVSSLGRFRSTSGVISKPSQMSSGYVQVKINCKLHKIHRLIALAFDLPRAEGQTTVNHKDGNPGNNCVENLEFASPSEQIRHSFATNSNRKSNAVKRSKPVRGRRVGETEWVTYPSIMEAARKLGLHCASISACCTKKKHQTSNFEFQLAEPAEPVRLDGEVWRAVQGTNAAVSSLGRFRSTTGVVSTPSPSLSGYVSVKIDGKSHLLHRLRAIAFDLPRAEGQNTVNHKDGNRSNNVLTNLEFASPSEQARHSFATNTKRRSSASKLSKPVRGRRVGETEWVIYPSIMEAARALGMNNGSVSACCKKKLHQTGNFVFEFADPTEPELLEGEVWRDVVSFT